MHVRGAQIKQIYINAAVGNIQNKNSYTFFYSDKNLDAFKSEQKKISYDF